MKKILIVNNNMHMGGVQKALVSLLWNIQDSYEVTLLLFYPKGECLKDIPPKVKVIPAESAYRCLGITKDDACGGWNRLCRSFYAALTRLTGRKNAIKLMSMGQKQLGPYDVAISYLHDSGEKVFYGGCNDFVLNHVSAKKKVTFLHCDYQLCGANHPENAKKYARFDGIAACSQGCADSFLQANPALREKVRVVNNCHRFSQIREAAEAAPVSLRPDRINVVTVARLGKEKGVQRALRVLTHLGPLKDKLQYYIIGDGIEKPTLLRIIEEEGLSQCVTMCGMLSNPYGYIKAADFLLIPSYNEAAPLVIGEAASLGTPVLSTRTSSAKEMITDAGIGWVCENSEEGIAKAVKELLTEPDSLAQMRNNLAQIALSNHRALAQFAEMLEDEM